MAEKNDVAKGVEEGVDGQEAPIKNLSPEAARALAEAEARRAEYDKVKEALPREINGRGGAEPVRYGDWENKGIASDF